MQLTIEGNTYNLPSSLMQVTLQQRIDYDITYGKGLTERLTRIIDIKDETLKEIEFTGYQMELACKTLAFFGKIPLEVVEKTDVKQVLTVYHHTMKGFSEDVDFANKEELISEFEWNGDTWTIAAPELNENSKMTFGEFVTSKQVVQEMVEFGHEKWGALLKLCCIYFRKKGEPYSDDLINEDKERYKLLQTLPLQYALQTGFFLMRSTSSWIDTFLSSGNQEAKEQEYLSESILRDSAG
jgi:hypothetical protein